MQFLVLLCNKTKPLTFTEQYLTSSEPGEEGQDVDSSITMITNEK